MENKQKRILAGWIIESNSHDFVPDADIDKIEVIGIEASESRRWSAYTSEDFSCTIKYKYDGQERYLYMGEGDVVDMLNWMSTDLDE